MKTFNVKLKLFDDESLGKMSEKELKDLLIEELDKYLRDFGISVEVTEVKAI